MTTSSPSMDSPVGLGFDEKDLFRSVMRGDYDRVQEIYKQSPAARKARITRSEDTALHIAVSNGKEQAVEQLVQLIKKTEGKTAVETLKIENGRGNTPLHLAAASGNVRMCRCIAKIDPELIGTRNRDNETPFFLAALYGRKDVFLCLHNLIPRENSEAGYSYSRRADGETILHCALSGEYFDLAFQIIHRYKNLVNYVNEKGFSPLHLLASNPSAFPSGSHISRFGMIIYHSIFVDKLEAQHHPPPVEEKKHNGESSKTVIENCRTCVDFAQLLWGFLLIVVSRGKKTRRSQPSDVENSQGQLKAQLFPPNCSTCFELIKFMSKAVLIVLSLGSRDIVKIKEKKEKHTWAIQIMDELLVRTVQYEYDNNGRNPQREAPSLKEVGTEPYEVTDGGDVEFNKQAVPPTPPEDNSAEDEKEEIDQRINEGQDHMLPKIEESESAILIAAKYGVAEMVDKILQLFPVAVHDVNSVKKNVVLLAVENRQPNVYKLLLDLKFEKDPVFHKVDKDGNSALHLAARLGEYRPWLIPGAALQMQWEIKWYEFVKTSMRRHFFVRFNRYGKTPREVFTETHKDLVQRGGDWLNSTSNSCSVVATLIATIAFATAATVPGGVKQDTGTPTLENEPVFNVFAISSLVALCFSVTALAMFLSILTSRHQEKDFGTNLPRKLLWGLSSLFVSIASVLISFCAGHYFVLKDQLKFSALPIYLLTCLPVTFFAAAQFPLYVDLIWATIRAVPQRSYKIRAMATTNVFQRGDLSVKSLNVKNSAIPLDLLVVTPVEKGTYPVLQFHHGFMCRSISYSQLLQHIASHGFIIVAPQESLPQIIQSETKQIQDLAAVTNWLATGLQPELPDLVYADFTKFGLSGHSKGGKTAFSLALGAAGITLNLKVSALIVIDPVAGVNTLIRTQPNILTYIPRAFNLGIPIGVIGTGLGGEKKNIMTLPCAPNGVNHAEFFNKCKPPRCYLLAKDYGHMDMLDDTAPELEKYLCKSGTNPKELMRRGTGGIVVAFMKAYLQGDYSDLLAIVNDPKIAPIKLDPVIYARA